MLTQLRLPESLHLSLCHRGISTASIGAGVKNSECAVNIGRRVVKVRRKAQDSAPKRDVDASIGKRSVDGRIALALPVREEHESGTPRARLARTQQVESVEVEALDEAFNKVFIMGENALDPYLEEVLDSCCPGFEVEEVCRCEYVEGLHAQAVPKFGVNNLFREVFGRLHGEPVGFYWLQPFTESGTNPAEAGAVGAT